LKAPANAETAPSAMPALFMGRLQPCVPVSAPVQVRTSALAVQARAMRVKAANPYAYGMLAPGVSLRATPSSTRSNERAGLSPPVFPMGDFGFMPTWLRSTLSSFCDPMPSMRIPLGLGATLRP